MPDFEFIERITRDLMDKGKPVEAGWTMLRYLSIPLNAPRVQVDEMRSAFFAGAAHILALMTEGLDATRIELIDKELQEFLSEYELMHSVTKGSA